MVFVGLNLWIAGQKLDKNMIHYPPVAQGSLEEFRRWLTSQFINVLCYNKRSLMTGGLGVRLRRDPPNYQELNSFRR